jgi:hypothetical protein
MKKIQFGSIVIAVLTMSSLASAAICMTPARNFHHRACGGGRGVARFAEELATRDAVDFCVGPNRTHIIERMPVRCFQDGPRNHCCEAEVVAQCEVACDLDSFRN